MDRPNTTSHAFHSTTPNLPPCIRLELDENMGELEVLIGVNKDKFLWEKERFLEKIEILIKESFLNNL